MADRLKDEEDLKLEALFGSDPVPDDGFSRKVVSRVRRQIWVQRLSLPTAVVIGAILAAKPLMQVVKIVPNIVGQVPQALTNVIDVPMVNLPQLSTVVLAILLLAVTLIVGRTLED